MITLEQAIEFENKSIAIYESLASKVSLPGLKSLFNSIAHEGQYHLDMISSITNNSEICIIHHPDIEDLCWTCRRR
jgi:rubrerythrin